MAVYRNAHKHFHPTKMTQKFAFSLLFAFLTILASCGKAPKAEELHSATPPKDLTKIEVERIFNLYVQKDFTGYVNMIQSCDDKPEAYRREMATLFKQHAADQARDSGDITSVEVANITMGKDRRSAEVYLNISYTNRDTEEILLQFVHDGKTWRLR